MTKSSSVPESSGNQVAKPLQVWQDWVSPRSLSIRRSIVNLEQVHLSSVYSVWRSKEKHCMVFASCFLSLALMP